MGSRPLQQSEYHNEVTCIVWFPNAYKSYLYTLKSIKCTIALCQKTPMYIFQLKNIWFLKILTII